MSEGERYYRGYLIAGESTTPVLVRYASRYSLWLHFDGEEVWRKPEEYKELTFDFDGLTVKTGPCRVFREPGAENGDLRLVPLQTIHDFEKLFFRSKVETLESTAANLPLVLSYKRSIKREFADFVSELTYDLSAYRTILDQIDGRIALEPDSVQPLLQRGIIESIGGRLLNYLEQQHQRLKLITSDFSDEEHEHHGFYFRKQLWNTILTAPLMDRTNTKPRGYIGDSEMMRMIYSNDFEGDSTFGKIMHKHAVGQRAADAVRNRRREMAKLVTSFAQFKASTRSGNGEPIKILSIACGPAMELYEILQGPEDCDRYHFSLLDQDRHALLEAAGTVEDIQKKFDVEVSADFINESVRTMLVTKELQNRWGRFDFIYSMGLFDYLTMPVAVALLRKLTNLVSPGGTMVIGNFAHENPTATFMAYWMDWPIIYRSENDMLEMAAKVNDVTARVFRDESQIQMLMHLDKKEPDE